MGKRRDQLYLKDIEVVSFLLQNMSIHDIGWRYLSKKGSEAPLFVRNTYNTYTALIFGRKHAFVQKNHD